MNPTDTPLLLIAWRRPHTLRQVIDAIRPVAPTRLYVACDGPNPDRPGEAEKVAATRAVIEHEIDWPCQIERLYSDINQGCRLGVSRAITWFFEQVEEGIILEDDCVPHPDFFPYCNTLLERYRHDTRVWCISGNNFQNGQWRGDGSYYFSRYNHCWGWASWRRCWQHYGADLSQWPTLRDSGLLDTIFEDPLERNYWSGIWQRLLDTGQPDTWDYQWTLTCLANSGLTALPNRNLVSNVGFGEDATHTLTGKTTLVSKSGLAPISHPTFCLRCMEADSYFFHSQLLPPPRQSVMKEKLAKAKNKLSRLWQADTVSQSDRPPALFTQRILDRLSSAKRYSPGVIAARNGRTISYSDACTLVAGHAEIFLDRVYDFSTSSDKPIIIDCGANIGLASIWFALRFPRSRIFAYEADPSIYKYLVENISSFGFDHRIVSKNMALWKDSSGVKFDTEGGFSGQISGHAHDLVKDTISVPSISLSKAISGFERIDLLKIDIEGAENQIFSGEINLRFVDRLFLEYHSHQSDPQVLDKILRCLSRNGFRYHIKEAYPSTHPFLQIESLLGMDLQLNIYCYRI